MCSATTMCSVKTAMRKAQPLCKLVLSAEVVACGLGLKTRHAQLGYNYDISKSLSRHYDDKAAEVAQGFWNCPCVPMRER
ncbi:hypothetical protein ZIOFF_039087 [Zingiber officinale]|uniref:Ferredoxin-thioredoxin reductase catalytic chain, chloroplastic n=1 Tax=Zingiber officinale TaxID=94328 RepID=A0A8J5G1P4_ZINOF|nr:hypothetical protein ZIOFF_039087 [Zingiber officinale]